MPSLIVDHHLKDFDDWFELFERNPPPPIGTWRLFCGRDDPNRVFVIGEFGEAEVDAVREWAASAPMQETFKKVNEMSEAPMEFVWVNDETPK